MAKTDIIMSCMSDHTGASIARVVLASRTLHVGQTVLVRREDANKYLLGFPASPKGPIGVLKSTTGDFSGPAGISPQSSASNS
jgi:hypothetical protein